MEALNNALYGLSHSIKDTSFKVEICNFQYNTPRSKGFITDRYISSNTVTIQNLIDYVNRNYIALLLICFDFEKAYDSIEWGFLFEVLKYFNFGEKLLNGLKYFIVTHLLSYKMLVI